MTYDPNKKEWWTIMKSGSGFWRKGEVTEDQYTITVFGTWNDIKYTQIMFQSIFTRQQEEKTELEETHKAERERLYTSLSTTMVDKK